MQKSKRTAQRNSTPESCFDLPDKVKQVFDFLMRCLFSPSDQYSYVGQLFGELLHMEVEESKTKNEKRKPQYLKLLTRRKQ